jgi:hypothetical protein
LREPEGALGAPVLLDVIFVFVWFLEKGRENHPAHWGNQKREQYQNSGGGNYSQKLRANHHGDQANNDECALNHASQTQDFAFQFLNLSPQSELVVAHKSWITSNGRKLRQATRKSNNNLTPCVSRKASWVLALLDTQISSGQLRRFP